jgi:hypothetical protein
MNNPAVALTRDNVLAVFPQFVVDRSNQRFR